MTNKKKRITFGDDTALDIARRNRCGCGNMIVTHYDKNGGSVSYEVNASNDVLGVVIRMPSATDDEDGEGDD